MQNFTNFAALMLVIALLFVPGIGLWIAVWLTIRSQRKDPATVANRARRGYESVRQRQAGALNGVHTGGPLVLADPDEQFDRVAAQVGCSEEFPTAPHFGLYLSKTWPNTTSNA